MSKRLSFEKLHNTRDLGGMRAEDGSLVKEGLLFRSGHLSDISESDAGLIAGLATTIVDFRSESERGRQPDQAIAGTENIHIPIVDDLTAGITREKESDRDLFERMIFQPERARAYMCQMYRGFVSDYAVSQYRQFLSYLMESSGGVLWHCTAGKDRAGIASVIVEEILGVAREEIIADYLKTNDYLQEDILFLSGYVKKQVKINTNEENVLADASLHYLFGADKVYIRAYYKAVEEKYGSFDQMIRDGLGLDEAEKQWMRNKYLEGNS